MDSWNSLSVFDFLIAHARQPISVRQRGTSLRITGKLAEVGDRNACSMDLVEADVEVGIPGLSCSLTVHEKSVLVHLSGGAGNASLFFPMSIPYPDLILESGDLARPQAEPAAQAHFKRL
jgi:hypothetical protein